MVTNYKFAVFILTHGRPGHVITYSTIRNQGYTGDIYLIVDNEDDSLGEYHAKFPGQVIVFDKRAIAKTFDAADSFSERRAVVYARNACFDIAKDHGIDYFLQLDDDYTGFWYKFNSRLEFRDRRVKSLDKLFGLVLDYYSSIDALSIAFGQGGDLLGGGNSTTLKRLWLKRKCMNTFFCSTLRPFQFVGRVNEDVNTFLSLGNRGQLLFTIFNVCITQVTTQASGGGMTDLYHAEGTYIKSFYPLMITPSNIKLYEMGHKNKRIHHKVLWNNAVPKIISEDYRKVS
jgi:hypothetical protein